MVVRLLLFCYLLLLLPAAVISFSCNTSYDKRCHHNRVPALRDNANDDNSFNRSLSRRIAEVRENENAFVYGLRNRVDKIVEADELDTFMSMKDANNNTIVDSLSLPWMHYYLIKNSKVLLLTRRFAISFANLGWAVALL